MAAKLPKLTFTQSYWNDSVGHPKNQTGTSACQTINSKTDKFNTAVANAEYLLQYQPKYESFVDEIKSLVYGGNKLG